METPAMQRRTEGINAIESQLAYWVHYVGYRVSHELRLRARHYGVTAAEWVVLRTLYDEGFKPTHLALRLGQTRGAISRLAARLEAKGLLHRDKSLSDRRAQWLTLTGLGRTLVPMLAAVADETNTRNFGGAADALLEPIERVMKWVVRRDRRRFVPPVQCRVIRGHRCGDADEAGDGDGEGYG
jgi:DNA-binding MarR family transcriptional regulator